jgi:uncharacterized glyoxalase superfamily protein PhnB
MKPPPPGWLRLSGSVFYEDPQAAIAWLCRVFGFEVRLKIEGDGGSIVHSELVFGGAVVMVSGTGGNEPWQQLYQSPRSSGKVTQALAFYIDEVDVHYARAVAEGANVVRELRTDDYGDDYWSDRTYGALDLEGHLWWFIERMRNPSGGATK